MTMRELAARLAHRLRPRAQPPATDRDALRFAAAFTVGRKVCIETMTAAEAAAIFRDASAIISEPASEPVDRYVFAIEAGAGLEPAMDQRAGCLSRDGMLLTIASSARDCDEVTRVLKRRFAVVRRFAGEQQVVEIPGETRSHEGAGWSVVIGTNDERWRHSRLHLGSGPLALDGWINLDNQPYAGVDFRWDVSDGIPFIGAELIFAEHFLEHLAYAEAAEFVAACRRSLSPEGTLRLSTPNLDWVWTIAYRPHAWTSDEDAQRDCFITNRAFRGWGHQFLYNGATLIALLQNGGFADVAFRAYARARTSRFAISNGIRAISTIRRRLTFSSWKLRESGARTW